MTAYSGFRVGDVVRIGDVGDVRAIILKVGRGNSRSILIKYEQGPVKIVTEVDYWQDQGILPVLSRKPKNVQWAKEFVALNGSKLPLV